MTEYEKQADDFLKQTKTRFKTCFIGHGNYFDDDKQKRDFYQVTLTKGNEFYSFKFGQSIANSKRSNWPKENERPPGLHPKPYDVLACLQKHDPGSFDDFCSDFGYDLDSIKARKTYQAVRDEFLNLSKLFSEKELEAMAEIQ